MILRKFLLVALVVVAGACAQVRSTESNPAAPTTLGATTSARQAQLAGIAQWIVGAGQNHGSYFLPPYQVDENGDITIAGRAGFGVVGSSGNDLTFCSFQTTSEKRFFRIGPHESALDHVNGPAVASYLRLSPTFDVLEELTGEGTMTLHAQGTLQVILSSGSPFYTIFTVGDPISSEIWSGGAKLGNGRDLKCGLRNDPKTDNRTYLDLK